MKIDQVIRFTDVWPQDVCYAGLDNNALIALERYSPNIS